MLNEWFSISKMGEILKKAWLLIFRYKQEFYFLFKSAFWLISWGIRYFVFSILFIDSIICLLNCDGYYLTRLHCQESSPGISMNWTSTSLGVRELQSIPDCIGLSYWTRILFLQVIYSQRWRCLAIKGKTTNCLTASLIWEKMIGSDFSLYLIPSVESMRTCRANKNSAMLTSLKLKGTSNNLLSHGFLWGHF